MGAAGDMLTAALMELLPDQESFVRELNGLGIPGVVYKAEKSVKCGITGTQMIVSVNGETEEAGDGGHAHDHEHSHDHDHSHEDAEHAHDHEHSHDHEHGHEDADHDHGYVHDHGHEYEEHAHDHGRSHAGGNGEHHTHDHHHDHAHHHHSSMADIRRIVGNLTVSDKVKEDILAVYALIADAESKVHGVPVEEIHFHEVGSMDAVADVTAVCLLMERLHPDQVIASPVNVGSGHVHCAHGIMPVPAPAAALLLQGIPIYSAAAETELCTPTGAALLRYFVSRFTKMPVMRVQKIGYGCGHKDFETANCLRAMLGDTEEPADSIYELACNLDDMTPEAAAYAQEKILEAGALDVCMIPAQMKKSRPGFILLVQCREQDRDSILPLIFRHTSTIGVRMHECRRFVMNRHAEKVQTPFGEVRRKVSEGFGVTREKYEYDDIARIADEKGISLAEVMQALGDNR